jgi:hypothetical protein
LVVVWVGGWSIPVVLQGLRKLFSMFIVLGRLGE